MLRTPAIVSATVFLAAAVLAADSPWTKVQELKSRTELRIFRKGAREPLNATFDEANDQKLIVVVKNEQLAIPKEDIDRLDARPLKGGRKTTVESSAKQTEPDTKPHPPNAAADVPGTSYSSGVNFGGKPDFETVYQRPPAAPKQ